jgi:hypothetical protein
MPQEEGNNTNSDAMHFLTFIDDEKVVRFRSVHLTASG